MHIISVLPHLRVTTICMKWSVLFVNLKLEKEVGKENHSYICCTSNDDLSQLTADAPRMINAGQPF